MTASAGAPYPHPNPAPNSNQIGSFVIGVSPIGTIAEFDVWQTVLSQYANSGRITSLVESFNAAVDPTATFDAFYDNVWNVATATGYGLDVWGRIVGVSRVLALPSSSVTYFGFEEASSWQGFGGGGGGSPFYSGGAISSSIALDDPDFRTLIYAKAMGNISDGSIPSLNKILLSLFPGKGPAWVSDGLNMSLTYNFSFALTPVQAAIVGQDDVLPNPAGVSITIAQGVPFP